MWSKSAVGRGGAAMWGRLASIAANTYRETIRNKILYTLLGFALLVIGLTSFLADLSFGELSRVIANIGLASIQIFGVVMAVFLGITLVSREVEQKTVYLILSKPVPRWEFVVGKTLGLCATLAVTTAIMALVLFAVHKGYRYGGKAEAGILVSACGIYMELVVLTCVASLFSTFTTPVLSAMFTLSIFLIGHISRDLLFFGSRTKSEILHWTAQALYYALPNLEYFNWKNDVVYGGAGSASLLPWAVAYMLLYGGALLALACRIFARKDFK
jgi:ABC-type transport system involved in multi-copper enzyme maturation permease subunit